MHSNKRGSVVFTWKNTSLSTSNIETKMKEHFIERKPNGLKIYRLTTKDNNTIEIGVIKDDMNGIISVDIFEK